MGGRWESTRHELRMCRRGTRLGYSWVMHRARFTSWISVAGESCVVSTATADGISLVANKRGRYRLDKDPASLRVAYQFPSQPTEAASQAGGQVQIRFPEPLRARVLFNGRYGENTSPLDLEIRLPPVPISSSVTTHSHRQLFACQFDVQQPHWDWHHVVTTEHRAPDSTSKGSASTTTAGRGCCIG